MPTTPQYAFSKTKLEPADRPDLAMTIAVKLPASSTFVMGTILGELNATPGTFNTYNPAGADGTELPKCILAVDVTTDSNGVPSNFSWPVSYPDLAVPAYARGDFDTATIDTAMGDTGAILLQAIAAANWHLIHGTATAGVVHIG